MANATLLLQPGASQDAIGTVTPTLNGTVTTTSGQFGNAWVFVSNAHLTVPLGSYLNRTEGAVLIRFRKIGASYQYIFQCNSTDEQDYFAVAAVTARNLDHYVGTLSNQFSTNLITLNQWHVLGLNWNGATITSYLDGVANPGFTNRAYTFVNPLAGFIWLASGHYAPEIQVEQGLFYNGFISDAQMLSLSTQASAWTWQGVSSQPRTPSFINTSGYSIIGSSIIRTGN
jgi:hypothetical protein